MKGVDVYVLWQIADGTKNRKLFLSVQIRTGERVIYDKIEDDHNEIKEMLSSNTNKEHTQNYSRFLWIIDYLILKSFIDKSEEIKADNQLTEAFEGVLLAMIELNNPKAAVILEEFNVHLKESFL